MRSEIRQDQAGRGDMHATTPVPPDHGHGRSRVAYLGPRFGGSIMGLAGWGRVGSISIGCTGPFAENGVR